MSHTASEFNNLGWNYENGIGVEKNERKAFDYYQKSAEMGDAKGTCFVGYCYHNGIGVEKDEYKVFFYYQKSAEMENAEGTYNVGYCYRNGIGVEKDGNKAFFYFQKSADMGDVDGIFALGNCYRDGIGVEKDENKAFFYFQKSADMGNAIAMTSLGNCYRDGKGVTKDERKAFEWYKKAANMNGFHGISNLSDCYRNGIGVQRDIQRANHWYRKLRSLKKINKITHEEIDDGVKNILNDEKYKISWINYNEFNYIREIGKGGFATVFYAYWYNKNDNVWKNVALKVIHNSNKEVENFIQELKYYCEIGYENPSFLECHGVSRDDTTKDYILVLKYANNGSLRQNLQTVSQSVWKDKLNILYCIASDLEAIHSQELIHRDLHSGNILQANLYSAYITDLGLSASSEIKQEGEISGVMPYVAPEVLQGEPFTQEADIYSFGIIMSELATGKRAFDGVPFDTKLSVRICRGERPGFSEDTPKCYVELAERCIVPDQNKRPTATTIYQKIGNWLDEMNQDKDNEIKKQFFKADNIKPKLNSPIHSNDMYSSKLINTRKITNAISISKIAEDEISQRIESVEITDD